MKVHLTHRFDNVDGGRIAYCGQRESGPTDRVQIDPNAAVTCGHCRKARQAEFERRND